MVEAVRVRVRVPELLSLAKDASVRASSDPHGQDRLITHTWPRLTAASDANLTVDHGLSMPFTIPNPNNDDPPTPLDNSDLIDCPERRAGFYYVKTLEKQGDLNILSVKFRPVCLRSTLTTAIDRTVPMAIRHGQSACHRYRD
jgi:hypothetical protein